MTGATPRATRKREHAALRRYLTDLLGTRPHDPLLDPCDCRHGCNGMCVESGSERCDFTCHPTAPQNQTETRTT